MSKGGTTMTKLVCDTCKYESHTATPSEYIGDHCPECYDGTITTEKALQDLRATQREENIKLRRP